MVELLILENPANDREAKWTLVVLDTGIYTEDNLALIKEKGGQLPVRLPQPPLGL